MLLQVALVDLYNDPPASFQTSRMATINSLSFILHDFDVHFTIIPYFTTDPAGSSPSGVTSLRVSPSEAARTIP